tara:strand:+ start:2944 stop:3621 length:678 start_codon:yes stop_codon:yes gene_type:complete
MKIKKGDFIEIDYVGTIKDTGEVFDLTKKDVAANKGVANKSADYSPKVLRVGNGDIVKGLDDFFVDKEIGKSYTVGLNPENAFGKKNAKLIKMIPLNVFKKQEINPYPGLQVDIDNMFGIVRTVSGGRVLVDFNHPLSGREIVYEVDIRKKVNDTSKKVESVVKNLINKEVKCSVDDGTACIELDVPGQFQKLLSDKITESVDEIKKVEFKNLKAKAVQDKKQPL